MRDADCFGEMIAGARPLCVLPLDRSARFEREGVDGRVIRGLQTTLRLPVRSRSGELQCASRMSV
jgi:hypothetical protein